MPKPHPPELKQAAYDALDVTKTASSQVPALIERFGICSSQLIAMLVQKRKDVGYDADHHVSRAARRIDPAIKAAIYEAVDPAVNNDDQLPQLCKRFGVGEHTVRNAIRDKRAATGIYPPRPLLGGEPYRQRAFLEWVRGYNRPFTRAMAMAATGFDGDSLSQLLLRMTDKGFFTRRQLPMLQIREDGKTPTLRPTWVYYPTDLVFDDDERA